MTVSLTRLGYLTLLLFQPAFTAHEDVAWINTLVDWVARLITEHPQVKVIGICFGHQIITRACGGKLERNPKGWEVATTKIELTDVGKKVLELDSDYVVSGSSLVFVG